LTVEDVYPEELEANLSVIVTTIPAPISEITTTISISVTETVTTTESTP
jgi:hypothetical protein